MDYENDTTWVRGMLHPGENLLWTGKPEKVRIFGKEDVFLIPFSLFWCGFVAFSVWNTWRDEDGGMFSKLFMIPFVAAGFWLLIGRFAVKLLSAKNERYALTSQRVIVRKGKTTKSLDLLDLPRMSVTQREDGSGDIRFGESTDYYRRSGSFSWGSSAYQASLLELRGIPDVNRLEYRIRTAADQLREARN